MQFELAPLYVRAARGASAGSNAAFERFSPCGAETMKRLAVANVPVYNMPVYGAVQIETLDAARGEFQLSYAGAELADSYIINFSERFLGPGDLACAQRDRTTGRRMFANRMVVGLALGLKHHQVRATGLTGGYVWARAGVLPDSEEESAYLSDTLFKRATQLKNYIGEDQYDRLLDLCHLATPDCLYAIAHMDDRPGIPSKTFTRALERTTGPYNYDYYADRGFMQGGLSISKFMLMGLTFDSIIMMNNAAQMDRIESYCRVDIRVSAQLNQPTQCAERSSIPACQTVRPQ